MEDDIKNVPPIELTKMVRFSTIMGMLDSLRMVGTLLADEIEQESCREAEVEWDGEAAMPWSIELLPDPRGDFVTFEHDEPRDAWALKLANAISARAEHLGGE